MTSKKTAAILTIVGGVFYIIGGAVIAALLSSVSSLGGLGLGDSGTNSVCQLFGAGGFCAPTNSTSPGFGNLGAGGLDLGGIADILLAVGVVTGGLIIFGGILINSEIPDRRKAGGILVIVMILLGGLTTFGGLVIGFIRAGIGAYLGLTYKSNSRGMVIGLGPIGSVHLGSPAGGQSNSPAGTGPLNYCIKCGSQIRPGSVFCGACGARVVD
jgi:zinc ribbon protein